MKKNGKISNWKRKLVSLLVLSLTLSNFNAIMVKAAENDTYVFEYPTATSLGSLETTALFAENYTGNHIEGNVVVENLNTTCSFVPKTSNKSIVVNPYNFIGQTNTQSSGDPCLVVVGDSNTISSNGGQVKVNEGTLCGVNGVMFKTMTEASCTFDFDTAKDGLIAFSEQLYTYPAGEYNDGKILVVECNVSDLQKEPGDPVNNVKREVWTNYVNKYDAVIINVKASGSVEYKGFGSDWDDKSKKILWNFGSDVTDLSVKDCSSGTILAPNAKMHNNGNINGSLFVTEFVQQGEIHQMYYNGLMPEAGSNTTSDNTTSGNTTSDNTTSGNTTSGNTTSDNTTSGNTTSGNTTSDNTTSGNTTSDNTTSGNTTSDNTTSGNTTSGNTTSDNTTSDNTTSGNTTSDNTTSENTTSGNTTSDNTTSGNTTNNTTTNNVTNTTTNNSVNTTNDQGVLGADRGGLVTIADGDVALSDQGVLGADRLPQTGDSTLYWESALVAALAGLGLLGVYYKKSEKMKK